MAVFKFGNFETEIDTTDFDFMQALETHSMEVMAALANVSKDLKQSERIKEVSTICFTFFDAMFGEGASEQLFEGQINERLCTRAVDALGDAVAEDKEAYASETMEILTKAQERLSGQVEKTQTRRAKTAKKAAK